MSITTAVTTVFDRARRGYRRFGVVGGVRRVAAIAGHWLSRALYVREQHVWYMLDLTAPLSQITCPPGFDIAMAAAGDVALLEQLPTIGAYIARQRLAAGTELWLLREGTHAASACWIFRDRTPVFAARTGWLTLPPHTVCLEDTVTSPAYRGRGLAGTLWSDIARGLQRQHVAAIITKVAADNTASRRAVEKAGFAPVAVMTLTRRAFRARVTLVPSLRSPLTAFLEPALAR